METIKRLRLAIGMIFLACSYKKQAVVNTSALQISKRNLPLVRSTLGGGYNTVMNVKQTL
ncbi:hypothetical protein [Mucilaginibacter pocheonensis]|uniref:Uncharacterized protein n=1 Tax=Mucilaginibacter pocheonensis TaxID=398050 RepID=A0ABU1T8G2_9SPHI|nr:hypothetical protein [Mucilaginibacter pocheonensis]MDR6941146.1 hypothetical protein [Mucilaginibacter pocheonensis]